MAGHLYDRNYADILRAAARQVLHARLSGGDPEAELAHVEQIAPANPPDNYDPRPYIEGQT